MKLKVNNTELNTDLLSDWPMSVLVMSLISTPGLTTALILSSWESLNLSHVVPGADHQVRVQVKVSDSQCCLPQPQPDI